MTAIAAGIIVAGIAFVVGLALAFRLDGYAAAMAVLILGFGWLGLRVVRRSSAVTPSACPECGGLVSPNAPYCKHCKAIL